MKTSIKDFFSKSDQIPADLVTFTEKILTGKLHFWCSELFVKLNFLLWWSCRFVRLRWRFDIWHLTQNAPKVKATILVHTSIIWPVWPNGWVFVYKLSGSGFDSSCSHINHCIGITHIYMYISWKYYSYYHNNHCRR